MKLNTWLAIKSVVCIVFGVLFVAIPQTVMDIYGVQLDPGTEFVARFFGASFILLSIILWMARSDEKSHALRAIVMGVTIGDFIGFGVALWAQLDGVFNNWGWTIVALYLVLALVFAYELFRAPEVSFGTAQ